MISSKMLSTLQTLGSKLGVAVVLDCRNLNFYGATGSHWLDAGNSDDARAMAHFQGFAEAQPTWEKGFKAIGPRTCGDCPVPLEDGVDCPEVCRPYAVPGLADGYVDTCRSHARRAAWDTLLDVA